MGNQRLDENWSLPQRRACAFSRILLALLRAALALASALTIRARSGPSSGAFKRAQMISSYRREASSCAASAWLAASWKETRRPERRMRGLIQNVSVKSIIIETNGKGQREAESQGLFRDKSR